jgi:tetratricopeptide (TPR) repeat protein
MAPPDEPSPSVASPGNPAPGGSPAGRLPWLPGLFLAVFAALLASFPARNTDLWMHLAAGRDLAWGPHLAAPAPSPSPDPQVNRAWLFDLVSYNLYLLLGGRGLLFGKAVLVVVLALVLFRLSRAPSPYPLPHRGGEGNKVNPLPLGGGEGRVRGWIPTVSTALALLAMSIHLRAQPATASYLFLALTLWLVVGPNPVRAGSPTVAWLPPWPLLVLFVVWANTDSWFVLGLGIVALVWLGRALDGDGVQEKENRRSPGRRVLLSVCQLVILAAVCLLNPLHVHAFIIPPAARQELSPFQGAYFAKYEQSPAALAYFPLLGLGLLSFVMNLPRWQWRRFLPWAGLALGSACNVKGLCSGAQVIPFFAVVAGPVLAWNLQDFFARHTATTTASPRPSILGRAGFALTAVLGLAFLVCAWPGWLQGPPVEPRRWDLEFPPSLERGAAAVRAWHQEGRLGPDARGLHLSPETAYAFAWFCPEEKGLVDDRLATALLRGADGWEKQLRAAGINHVIVYDPERGRLFDLLDRLLGNPEQWPLLHLEGDLAVFGWRDPARGGEGAEALFRGWELDLNRLAFQPAADRKAPRRGVDGGAESRRWWDAFWKPTPPRPIDRDEAMLHLLHAEALRRAAPQRRLTAWEAGHAAALVGAAGGWGGPGGLLDADVRLVLFRPPLPEAGPARADVPPLSRLALMCQQWYTLEQDDVPPARLYLAVRAARRALAANPADAQAHLVLGESYLRLLHSTRERAWGQRLPELVGLRRAQASTALNRAVDFQPDLAQAHLSLVRLYQEMGCLDLALKHLRAYQEWRDREAGKRGEKGKGRKGEREPEIGALSLPVSPSGLAEAVAEGEKAYAAEAGKLRVVDRAMLAFEKGLGGKARDLLLESDVAAFGEQGMAMELELLLKTGQANKVREWMSPEQESALGASSYHWLRAQALAALGEYALAEEECEQLVAGGRGQEGTPAWEVMALLAGQTVLNEHPVGASVALLPFRAVDRMKALNRVAALAKDLRQVANANVCRGLLLLEEGEVEEAEVSFRLALALWQDEAAAASGAGLDFNARPIAQGCLRWLSEDDKVTR